MILIEMPGNVRFILHMLHEAGHEAYIVGGCVRDSIMGKEPHDWDICTSATPEQVIKIFKHFIKMSLVRKSKLLYHRINAFACT